MEETSTPQGLMIGTAEFDALVIDFPAQGRRCNLSGGEQLESFAREQRIVTTVMFDVEHPGRYSSFFESDNFSRLRFACVQNLVGVAQTHVAIDGANEPLGAHGAAVFLADKGNFLAPQARRIKKQVRVFLEQVRHRVEKVR